MIGALRVYSQQWSFSPDTYTQLMAAQSAMYQATATEAANISDLLILARDVTATGAANPVLFEPDTTGVAMRRAVF